MRLKENENHEFAQNKRLGIFIILNKRFAGRRY